MPNSIQVTLPIDYMDLYVLSQQFGLIVHGYRINNHWELMVALNGIIRSHTLFETSEYYPHFQQYMLPQLNKAPANYVGNDNLLAATHEVRDITKDLHDVTQFGACDEETTVDRWGAMVLASTTDVVLSNATPAPSGYTTNNIDYLVPAPIGKPTNNTNLGLACPTAHSDHDLTVLAGSYPLTIDVGTQAAYSMATSGTNCTLLSIDPSGTPYAYGNYQLRLSQGSTNTATKGTNTTATTITGLAQDGSNAILSGAYNLTATAAQVNGQWMLSYNGGPAVTVSPNTTATLSGGNGGALTVTTGSAKPGGLPKTETVTVSASLKLQVLSASGGALSTADNLSPSGSASLNAQQAGLIRVNLGASPLTLPQTDAFTTSRTAKITYNMGTPLDNVWPNTSSLPVSGSTAGVIYLNLGTIPAVLPQTDILNLTSRNFYLKAINLTLDYANTLNVYATLQMGPDKKVRIAVSNYTPFNHLVFPVPIPIPTGQRITVHLHSSNAAAAAPVFVRFAGTEA